MIRILLFHMEEGRAQKAFLAVKDMGAAVLSVDESREKAPIALLAGERLPGPFGIGEELPPAVPFTEEMMVICGADHDTLMRMLKKLERAGFGGVLKAVMTPDNSFWNALQLYGVLSDERAAMHPQG